VSIRRALAAAIGMPPPQRTSLPVGYRRNANASDAIVTSINGGMVCRMESSRRLRVALSTYLISGAGVQLRGSHLVWVATSGSVVILEAGARTAESDQALGNQTGRL